MTEVYVLTRKVLDDEFVCEAVYSLSQSVRPGGGWRSVYFTTPDGKENYRAQRIFHGESPSDRRVIEFPTKKNLDCKPIARQRVVLTPFKVSRQRMREPCLVFVNAPVSWKEVQHKYPEAMLAGYAENQQEEILHDISGIDNSVFFEVQGNCIDPTDIAREFNSCRLLHALEYNCVAGQDSLEHIAVEGLRRRLVRNVDAFKKAYNLSIR